MRLKSTFFSLAVVIGAIAAFVSCEQSESYRESLLVENLTPEQRQVYERIKKVKTKLTYYKARVYEETNEALRAEFDNDWETYREHLTMQEFYEMREKEFNDDLKKLEKEMKQLPAKAKEKGKV